MNGMVIPGTSIAVDIWRIKDIIAANLFFLSHAHSDHMVGLTPSWRELIHTSPITAKILINRFKISQKYVVPLELGVPHLLYPGHKKDDSVTVTLFEAHHCPGSVMFLFQGRFGTILYTGDFRYHPSISKEIKESYSGSIDQLYLDNTYNDPLCSFPVREVVCRQIIELIQDKINQGYEIVIGIRNLGKENMLIDIATKLKNWIVVDVNQFELLQLLEVKNVFTTDTTASRIRAVPFHQVTSRRVRLWNLETPTVAILPTALYTGLSGNPFCKQYNMFVYHYSDHSSFTELQTFVSEIHPKALFPIVKGGRGPLGTNVSHRANMSAFDKFLDKSKDFPILEPFQELDFEIDIGHMLKGKPVKKRKLSLDRYQRGPLAKKMKGVIYENESPKSKSKSERSTSLGKNSDYSVFDELKNSEGKISDIVETIQNQESHMLKMESSENGSEECCFSVTLKKYLSESQCKDLQSFNKEKPDIDSGIADCNANISETVVHSEYSRNNFSDLVTTETDIESENPAENSLNNTDVVEETDIESENPAENSHNNTDVVEDLESISNDSTEFDSSYVTSRNDLEIENVAGYIVNKADGLDSCRNESTELDNNGASAGISLQNGNAAECCESKIKGLNSSGLIVGIGLENKKLEESNENMTEDWDFGNDSAELHNNCSTSRISLKSGSATENDTEGWNNKRKDSIKLDSNGVRTGTYFKSDSLTEDNQNNINIKEDLKSSTNHSVELNSSGVTPEVGFDGGNLEHCEKKTEFVEDLENNKNEFLEFNRCGITAKPDLKNQRNKTSVVKVLEIGKKSEEHNRSGDKNIIIKESPQKRINNIGELSIYRTHECSQDNYKLVSDSTAKKKLHYLSPSQAENMNLLLDETSKAKFSKFDSSLKNISNNLNQELSKKAVDEIRTSESSISTDAVTAKGFYQSRSDATQNKENYEATYIENERERKHFRKKVCPTAFFLETPQKKCRRSASKNNIKMKHLINGSETQSSNSSTSRQVYAPSFKVSLIPVSRQRTAQQKRVDLEKAFQRYYEKTSKMSVFIHTSLN